MTDSPAEPYRLGLDLGTNSIGWAAIRLDDRGEPTGVLDMGVRIFPDGRNPTDGSSLAVDRRLARGQRRRRDRYLKRRAGLLKLLIHYGLMPEDDAERKKLAIRDPYKLRAKALDETLHPHELGRALFHLNQRRGFKSNRKAGPDENEAKKTREEMDTLAGRIEESGSRTLGEFLAGRLERGETVRARTPFGAEKETDPARTGLYPSRKLYEDEFDALREAQKGHQGLSDERWDALHGVIFHQRPMERPPVGKCTLDPAKNPEDAEGFRCPWTHPLAQRFRIWQEVRNLEAQEVGQPPWPLSKEQGDTVAQALLQQNKVSFDKIRTRLNLPSEVYFNLESQKRKDLLGDETAAKLAHKDLFGKTWRKLPLDKQIEIVEQLLKEEDVDFAIAWLTRNAGVDHEAAQRIAFARLPYGHCRLGLRAIKKLLPHMEAGKNYPEAARAAGYDHARAPTGELSPTGRLPYYGEWLSEHLNGTGHPAHPKEKRWGRYPNPTVHVGLNQLRRVVNALIKEYGSPREAVVEMTRQFPLSGKRRADLDKEQKANQDKNKKRNEELNDLDEEPKYENRLKMRLWEELNPKNALDRRCPFTGEPISKTRLFSADVEIDHLIPWADSWDDSPANKIVCLRDANRRKGNLTPYEAFHATPEWEGIVQRAKNLPENKRWRFRPDARARFEKQGGFLARQLNETGWLARLAKEYLTAVVHPNHIWVSPGRLTAMIRAKWGLSDLLPNHNAGNVKDRTDHRHHAIDALVVGLTDRSLLKRMASAYDETRSKIKVPLPWTDFQNTVKRKLDKVIVSYKPDHGTRGVKGKTTGQLHDAMAWSLKKESEDGRYEIVRRKKLSEFKKRDALKTVWNPAMREALLKLWDKVAAEVTEEKKIPAKFAELAGKGIPRDGVRQPVRRVRIVEKQTVIPITDKDGKPYKGYLPGGNEFADVWRMRDGSWRTVVVPTFDANQPGFDIERFRPADKKSGRPDPAAKRLMRLQKDDMGAFGKSGDRRIVRVRQILASERVVMDDHNEANVDKRRRAKEIKEQSYNAAKLQRLGFRKVRVDEIGRVRDPGPRA